jgi:PAS domain S-box-containing protein
MHSGKNRGCFDETERETLESISSHLREGIFRSNGEVVLYANAAFIRMFGYDSLADIQKITVAALYANEEAQKFLTDMIYANGIVVDHRILYQKKDGKNFWGMLTSRLIKRKGEHCYEGLIIDLTDQITSERQLEEQTKQLEKLTLELDRFIYSASHDIRAPISTMMGIINLMKLEERDENTIRYVHMLERSIDRLDKYVYSLIGYTKNIKTRIEDKLVDPLAFFEKLFTQFRDIHPSYALLQHSIECDHRFVFYSDIERMNQIFFNIIKNAFDFKDDSKRNKIVSVKVVTHPEKLVVEIFDNGIGISASHLKNVFEMFYRASSRSKGSGIGLFSVRETVVKLGGVVTIDSLIGVGTTVKVELPNSKKGRLINKKNILKQKSG